MRKWILFDTKSNMTRIIFFCLKGEAIDESSYHHPNPMINFSIVNGNRYYSYLDVTKYGTHSIVSDVFQPKIFILNLIILFRSIFILLEVQGIREQVNVTRRRQWEKFVYRMSMVHLTQSMSGFDLQKTRCNVQSWLGPGLDKHVVKDILGTAGEI